MTMAEPGGLGIIGGEQHLQTRSCHLGRISDLSSAHTSRLLHGAHGRAGGRVRPGLRRRAHTAILERLRCTVRLNGFDGRVSVHSAPLAATPGEKVLLHVLAGLPQTLPCTAAAAKAPQPTSCASQRRM